MDVLALARRQLAAGWRHRWKALALAWLICLGGWGGVQMLPDQYQATARIYADADAILGMLLRGIAIDSSPAGQVEILQRTLLTAAALTLPRPPPCCGPLRRPGMPARPGTGRICWRSSAIRGFSFLPSRRSGKAPES